MDLQAVLRQYAQDWVEDAQRLRATGAEKGCEKCVVAAEVYEECSRQLTDILSHVSPQLLKEIHHVEH